MPDRRIIELIDKLPCGILKDSGQRCGHPAKVAQAITADSLPAYRQLGLTEGEWIFLPVCQDCTLDTAKLYLDADQEADHAPPD